MRVNFQLGGTNLKQRIAQFVGPIVLGILRLRIMKQINSDAKSQNLNRRTFAQFGGLHQRNIFNIDQTNSYLIGCFFFLFIDNTLITFFQLFGANMDKKQRYFIYNLLWILSVNIFFCVFIPVKHILLSRDSLPSLWCSPKLVRRTKFYVLQPVISPRRSECVVDNQKMVQKNFVFLRKLSLKNTIQALRVHRLDQNYSTIQMDYLHN